MDTLTQMQRSERMARIRSKDTRPELEVRRLLHSMGYRYRLHGRDLPGAPDLVFRTRRKVIFVHGCFWHAHDSCSVANRPKSRPEFWDAKFARNRERDAKHVEALRATGWDVHTVWECELKDRAALVSTLVSFLGPLGSCEDGNGTDH